MATKPQPPTPPGRATKPPPPTPPPKATKLPPPTPSPEATEPPPPIPPPPEGTHPPPPTPPGRATKPPPPTSPPKATKPPPPTPPAKATEPPPPPKVTQPPPPTPPPKATKPPPPPMTTPPQTTPPEAVTTTERPGIPRYTTLCTVSYLYSELALPLGGECDIIFYDSLLLRPEDTFMGSFTNAYMKPIFDAAKESNISHNTQFGMSVHAPFHGNAYEDTEDWLEEYKRVDKSNEWHAGQKLPHVYLSLEGGGCT
nr:uncharacterized protein LOC129381671 [Dermacentor andersoni]